MAGTTVMPPPVVLAGTTFGYYVLKSKPSPESGG
jgi:hypothetical protein